MAISAYDSIRFDRCGVCKGDFLRGGYGGITVRTEGLQALAFWEHVVRLFTFNHKYDNTSLPNLGNVNGYKEEFNPRQYFKSSRWRDRPVQTRGGLQILRGIKQQQQQLLRSDRSGQGLHCGGGRI